MMEDKLKDGWWETAIEIISGTYFSQMDTGSIEYIVRKLQVILKNDNLEELLTKIAPFIKEEEDNIGVVADIIYNEISIENLILLQEKVVKNEQFSDFVQDLFFELEIKCSNLSELFSKKEKEI